MTEKARDVTALFAALNITEPYREFQPTESASTALERWPLLRALEPLPEVKPVDSPDSLREFLFGGAPMDAAYKPAAVAPKVRQTTPENLFGSSLQRRASDTDDAALQRRAAGAARRA